MARAAFHDGESLHLLVLSSKRGMTPINHPLWLPFRESQIPFSLSTKKQAMWMGTSQELSTDLKASPGLRGINCHVALEPLVASFHCLRMFLCFPLLVLKGTHHYVKIIYIYIYFARGLKQKGSFLTVLTACNQSKGP